MDNSNLWIAVLCCATLLIIGCQPAVEPTPDPVAGTVHPEIWPQVQSPVATDPELEQAVDELLGKMSLEEKVGQVIQSEIRHTTPEDVRKYHLGSVLNGGGSHPSENKHATPEDWVALADGFWEASMDVSDGGQAIPIIWGTDAVHGHGNVIGATIFPHNVGLGAARNPELIRRIGEITAREVAVTGQDWDFGPTLAVVRDDRWGRTYEGYSEDPEIVADYAGKMVEGLQGVAGSDVWLDDEHMISTAKHFLGDGGTEGGKDQGDNQASEEELRDVHAAGYGTALGAGVQTVMASFNSWHGRKMHGYGELLTGVLKERMGFDGFIVGDWNGHGQVKGCSNDSCAAAFNAGVDMFMVPEDWKALYENTLTQVRSGEISAERLDDAVRRILRVKMRAGLFERGKPSSRPLAGKREVLGAAEHREVARQAVRESLVLLKNEGGLLPLRRDQRVLVAGDGADNVGKLCGGWTITWQGTGNVNSDFPGSTSIWDGIREVVEAPGGGVATLSIDGSYESRPDVAVVVFGEDPYAEFQGDRDSLEYQAGSKRDLRLLKKFKEDGIPVVSVFISGRPMWVNPELNASDAFVAAWLPGTEGGGVVDVLFRGADGSVAHDFQGKLSYSWPKQVSQNVLHRDVAGYDPLFPYGFGLTYADDGGLAELSEEVDVESGASATVYFDGGPVPPWQIFAEDSGGREAATGSVSGSPSGILEVRATDRVTQEDARSASWSGAGEASVVLATESGESVDLSRESNGDLALGFAIRVEQPPGAKVTLAIDCGEGCSGELDVTEAVAGAPVGEWSDVRIRLRCFADAGTDMTRVTSPFRISTAGTLGLGFADVRLVSAAEGQADCP